MKWLPQRFHFPARVKLKPPRVGPTKTSHVNTFSDAMWTSLWALKESSDAFPPLKSATSGVVALWEITEVNGKVIIISIVTDDACFNLAREVFKD
jgi:hypothetical protein